MEQPSLECKCGGDAAVCMRYEDMEMCCIIPSPAAVIPRLPGSGGILESSAVYKVDVLFNGADNLISNKGRINSDWGAK